jgi:hypothetical protein
MTVKIFDFAIFTTFAWLVPHVSIQIAGWRQTLKDSPDWVDERFDEGKKAVTRASFEACVFWILCIIATSVPIEILTEHLDPRMFDIIDGLGRIFAAIVTLIVSFKVPKWIGFYYSGTRTLCLENVGKSIKALRFNVHWSIGRVFIKMFFVLMPYYCGTEKGRVMGF